MSVQVTCQIHRKKRFDERFVVFFYYSLISLSGTIFLGKAHLYWLYGLHATAKHGFHGLLYYMHLQKKSFNDRLLVTSHVEQLIQRTQLNVSSSLK